MRERGKSNRAVGSNHAGQRVSGRRHIAAGDDRDGGAARKCSTGHRLMRGEQLREEGGVAHPTVAVAEAGVA